MTHLDFASVEGCTDSVQLTGVRTDWHPDSPDEWAIRFGFAVAFGINEHSGRAAALRLDGKANAVFCIVVEDGTDRYWYGPLSSAKFALEDPQEWTGLVAGLPPSTRPQVSR